MSKIEAWRSLKSSPGGGLGASWALLGRLPAPRRLPDAFLGHLGRLFGRLVGLLVAVMASTRPPKLSKNPINICIKFEPIVDTLGRVIFFDIAGFLMPKWSSNGFQMGSNFDMDRQTQIFMNW